MCKHIDSFEPGFEFHSRSGDRHILSGYYPAGPGCPFDRREQEFLGFTAAFLRGSGSFSPIQIALESLVYCPDSIRRRSGFRLGHHVAMQPFALLKAQPFGMSPSGDRY